jgi:hypothetical protein
MTSTQTQPNQSEAVLGLGNYWGFIPWSYPRVVGQITPSQVNNDGVWGKVYLKDRRENGN